MGDNIQSQEWSVIDWRLPPGERLCSGVVAVQLTQPVLLRGSYSMLSWDNHNEVDKGFQLTPQSYSADHFLIMHPSSVLMVIGESSGSYKAIIRQSLG